MANNQQGSLDYELARGYIGEGLRKSMPKVNEALSNSPPHTMRDATVLFGKAVWAGRKEYPKAAAHLLRGFMDGVGKQNPNDGRQLQKIQQGGQATRALKGPIASKGMTSGSLGSGKAASALKGRAHDFPRTSQGFSYHARSNPHATGNSKGGGQRR